MSANMKLRSELPQPRPKRGRPPLAEVKTQSAAKTTKAQSAAKVTKEKTSKASKAKSVSAVKAKGKAVSGSGRKTKKQVKNLKKGEKLKLSDLFGQTPRSPKPSTSTAGKKHTTRVKKNDPRSRVLARGLQRNLHKLIVRLRPMSTGEVEILLQRYRAIVVIPKDAKLDEMVLNKLRQLQQTESKAKPAPSEPSELPGTSASATSASATSASSVPEPEAQLGNLADELLDDFDIDLLDQILPDENGNVVSKNGKENPDKVDSGDETTEDEDEPPAADGSGAEASGNESAEQ